MQASKLRHKDLSNIVLIGMPGAGKSTIGVILAKWLSKDFIDTDILIQHQCNTSLQSIIDTHDYLELRRIEEEVILRLNAGNSVVATGGSAIYSDKAMNHLKKSGRIVYLRVDKDTLLRRIGDFGTRGIAKAKNQSFDSLFKERTVLYRKYGEITIDCRGKKHDEIALEIVWRSRL